jgi:hypothetical protein
MNSKAPLQNDSDDPIEESGLLRQWIDSSPPPEVDARLHRRFDILRQRMAARDLLARAGVSDRYRAWRMTAVAACVAFALAIALPVFLSGVAPTWAEVVKRFDAVPFFSATLYVKDHGAADPVQLELWMGQSGKFRLRAGNQVVFGEKGQLLETVELSAADEVSESVKEARRLVEKFIVNMGSAETFSLDTFIQALPWEGRLSSPLVNQNASIAKDLAVFDMASAVDSDWIRVWTLRESRLPMRMLFWNPADAASIDVVLSYANEQPASFFDPAAFKASLATNQAGDPAQAYTLLKGPGGRATVAGDLEKTSAPLGSNERPVLQ